VISRSPWVGSPLQVGHRNSSGFSSGPDRNPLITVDLLWFHFGYGSLFTLHDDNGWSYERAERWLAEQACRELLLAHTR
jgi:hypothetical protein